MIEWKTSSGLVNYSEAVAIMEERAALIRAGRAPEMVWLLEHPPIYTAGTSAKKSDLLEARFPVYETGRGGEYTYHGPGQRIAYVMLDLKKRYAPAAPDVRDFVTRLEGWIITALAQFGVAAFTCEGRHGVWVKDPGQLDRESKIAALGIRIRQGISYHGIAINLNPDLGHFSGIVPCGIQGYGVTSLAALGISADMPKLDKVLQVACPFAVE